MHISETHEKANFVRHDSCDDCGSSDAVGVYDDDIRSVSPVTPTHRVRNPMARQVRQPQYRKRVRPIQADLLQGEAQAIPGRT